MSQLRYPRAHAILRVMPASHSRLRITAPLPDSNADTWEVAPPPESYVCDWCERQFSGRATGKGLLLWTRGEELRYEEPPLCEGCAEKLLLGAWTQWALEDEGD